MQLYVGDFLSDTMHLSTEQIGAYMLLLMAMWRNGGKLPNDPAKMARVARVSPKRWGQVWSDIQGFFTVEGDSITNARLSVEIQKALSISAKRKQSGKAGGEANAMKYNKSGEANADQVLKHSQISDIIKKDDDDSACARENDFHSKVLEIAGDKFSDRKSRAVTEDWLRIEGLTEADILQSVRDTLAAAKGQPINSLNYFSAEIRRLNAVPHKPEGKKASRASKPKRDYDAIMSAAIQQIEQNGSIPK